jgi:hypothetical protein
MPGSLYGVAVWRVGGDNAIMAVCAHAQTAIFFSARIFSETRKSAAADSFLNFRVNEPASSDSLGPLHRGGLRGGHLRRLLRDLS